MLSPISLGSPNIKADNKKHTIVVARRWLSYDHFFWWLNEHFPEEKTQRTLSPTYLLISFIPLTSIHWAPMLHQTVVDRCCICSTEQHLPCPQADDTWVDKTENTSSHKYQVWCSVVTGAQRGNKAKKTNPSGSCCFRMSSKSHSRRKYLPTEPG